MLWSLLILYYQVGETDLIAGVFLIWCNILYSVLTIFIATLYLISSLLSRDITVVTMQPRILSSLGSSTQREYFSTATSFSQLPYSTSNENYHKVSSIASLAQRL